VTEVSELERISFHEDLLFIGFGLFLVVVMPLLARQEYCQARAQAPHAKVTWLSFAIAGVSFGFAALSTGLTHVWLTTWLAPDASIPEPVYTALDVLYFVTMAVTLLGFPVGGMFWILDKLRPLGAN